MSESEHTPDRRTSVAAWWRTVFLPIIFFLSGSAGFFYEVVSGHDATWGLLCALWAAGGPTLVADRIIRSLR